MNMLSIEEFVSLGYLQELNRRFLNTFGLFMDINKDGFASIHDYRSNPKDAVFNFQLFNEDQIADSLSKNDYINREMFRVYSEREDTIGFIVEPISKE